MGSTGPTQVLGKGPRKGDKWVKNKLARKRLERVESWLRELSRC